MAALAGAAILLGGTAIAARKPFSVHIDMTDHGFGFRNIGIRASKVRLRIENTGKHRHDVAIGRAGSQSGKHAIVSTKPLAPGQKAMLTAKLKPGRYRLYSKLDHDSAHGLSVPLVVMAPSVKGGGEMSRAFYNFR